MIHSTLLIRRKSKRTIAVTHYWTIKVPRESIVEYINGLDKLENISELDKDVSFNIGGNKFFSRECAEDILVIFVTDIDENDRQVHLKIEEAAKTLRKKLRNQSVTHIKENYEDIIAPFVHSKLKIALVGEGGVGKTTTLYLLMGRQPPRQYIPTIALNMEVVEGIGFANYSLVIWDFAGQERFRKLWKFYFRGCDICVLVCDSTLRNAIISKNLYAMIRRDAPNVPIVIIANKQDCPHAMDPSIIEKLIGAETHPMVAIDLSYRDKLMKVLLDIMSKYANLAIPDTSPDEVLRFSDELKITKEEIKADVA
jgi:small GTP-binding protein